MKKHFWLAAIMTPFLAFLGYALTDWYLKKDQIPSALKRLSVSQPCQLLQGCTLFNGDFTLRLKQSHDTLTLKANQRLKGVMVEVVGLMPPAKAKRMDTEGYQWSLVLTKPEAIQHIRMVVQSHWQNYIAEVTFPHGY